MFEVLTSSSKPLQSMMNWSRNMNINKQPICTQIMMRKPSLWVLPLPFSSRDTYKLTREHLKQHTRTKGSPDYCSLQIVRRWTLLPAAATSPAAACPKLPAAWIIPSAPNLLRIILLSAVYYPNVNPMTIQKMERKGELNFFPLNMHHSWEHLFDISNNFPYNWIVCHWVS